MVEFKVRIVDSKPVFCWSLKILKIKISVDKFFIKTVYFQLFDNSVFSFIKENFQIMLLSQNTYDKLSLIINPGIVLKI